MKQKEIIKNLSTLIKNAGGRSFFVGGYVRDYLLGKESFDYDIEVHGLSKDKLVEILSSIAPIDRKGEAYGIFSFIDYDIDVALPRIEEKVGNKHTDFKITIDPFLSFEDSCKRRDFTINAMLLDTLTNELIDPFNGKNDLESKIIRHVNSASFSEDPLRVLRAAQFAARTGFVIDKTTIELCRKIDLTSLSPKRVEDEMKKALLLSTKPSLFFINLKEMNQLSYWFKEVEQLIGVPQNPNYHPEGNVFNHTMEVIDRAALIKNRASNKYLFMLSALTHDFGKVITTTNTNGVIHSIFHEIKGCQLINPFLERLNLDTRNIRFINNMVFLHMMPGLIYRDKSSIKASNKMFDKAYNKMDLILFYEVDNKEVNEDYESFMLDRLKIYEETMKLPYVTGNDLIENGIIENEHFKEYLKEAHQMRLAQIPKKQALKILLAKAKKN